LEGSLTGIDRGLVKQDGEWQEVCRAAVCDLRT